jgi:acetyl/propionyl-CoA carboxylase alpha subunit
MKVAKESGCTHHQAAFGGGGRGMRVVERSADLAHLLGKPRRSRRALAIQQCFGK